MYSHFRNGCHALSKQKDRPNDISLSRINIVEVEDVISLEKKKETLRCKHCPKVLKSKLELTTHEGVHLKRFFSCNNCLRLYKDQETLDKHKEICSIERYSTDHSGFRPSMIFLPQFKESSKWKPCSECNCGCNDVEDEGIVDVTTV